MAEYCRDCSIRYLGPETAKLAGGLCKRGEITAMLCEGCGEIIDVDYLGQRITGEYHYKANEKVSVMSIVWKVIAAIFGGLMFTILGFMVISMVIGEQANESYGGFIMLGLFLISVVIVWKAKSPSKAWRRLLITCGIFSLALPLSTMVLSGSLIASGPEGDAAYAAGSAIGAGVATVFTGFVSIFLAAIFLITGLLIGRDRPAA